MSTEDQEKTLLEVCRKYTSDAPANVMFPEPYLPYKRKKWNGILVLAESQVIRNKQEKYAQWLQGLTPEQRMTRLGRKDPTPPYADKRDKIGIGPWDNGTIKLALQAIFERVEPKLKLEDVAVSNAVPWTRTGTGKNLNPGEEMQVKAAKFWEEIVAVWKPDIKALLVLGNVAERVMRKAGVLEKYAKNWLKLRLPSPNAINRVSGMFSCDDLKARFPEVPKALDALKMAENVEQYKMKVFFACHAVSLGVGKFKECFVGIDYR